MDVKLWMVGGTAWLLFAGIATAGDNNTLYLTQVGDGGALPNTFYADQSNSVGNSIVASQSGSGNVAHIITSGLCDENLATPCGSVGLHQTNTGLETNERPVAVGDTLARNYVSITSSGDSSATVLQTGDGNSATLNVVSGSGNIQQTGNDNLASLTVRDGTNGSIVQTNNHNTAALEVTGVPGAGASLTQTGGQTYTGPIVVNTIVPGTVEIVQN